MSQKLIDMDLVEKLQKQFGSANNIYLACLDSSRKVLSSCYCTGGEQRFFEERIPKPVMEMSGHWKMLVTGITISKTSWGVIGLIKTIHVGVL